MNHDYQYIMEIYREKSFTRAAQKLFISQPALSATVRRIESQLGYRIFDRNAKELTLTEEGQAYIDSARQIMDIEHDLTTRIHDIHSLDSGTLSIACTALYSTFVVPHIVKSFSQLHPRIQINFYEADSLLLYKEALNNHVDLIVDAGEYDERLFEAQKLFTENILLVVPSDCGTVNNLHLESKALSAKDIQDNYYLKPDCPSVSLSDFSAENFILLRNGHDISRRALAICNEAGFQPRCSIQLNQLLTAYYVSSNKLGITFVTDTVIKHCLPMQDNYIFKISAKRDSLLHRDVFIACKKDHYKTHAMKSFIDTAMKINIFD